MLFALIPGLMATEIVLHNQRIRIQQAEDNRLRSLPRDQQDFELRLREIKALEASARARPVINVKSSIF